LVCVIVADGDDHGEPMLRVDTARGAGADEIVGRRYPAAGTLSGRAIATGALASTEPGEPPSESVVRSGPAAAMALSVRAGDDVLGFLSVYRSVASPVFPEAERARAADYALQAGVALRLGRGRADRARLALIDDRARIARDLHDHVIQRLFGTGLTLQAL